MSTPLDVTVPFGRSVTDARVVRRNVLAALVVAGLVGGLGVGWDIRWHLLIGRDSFWIAPHVMIYAAVTAGAVLALGVLLLDTWRAGGGPLAGTVQLAGLTGTPGFHLAWWGVALTLVSAPIDDLWHRAFGIDVTLWSPPHLLGFLGAEIHGLGCLRVALELWPAGGAARLGVLIAGGTLLLGDFQVLSDQAVQTAYRHGGLLFFTYAVLATLLFACLLVLVARVTGSRLAPLAVVAGGIVLQWAILVVSDVGFALLQPPSFIAEAIASDPDSPIALAHEMARRAGAPQPGRSLTLRLAPVVPAALLVLVDARHRWAPAAAAFGAAMLAVTSLQFAGSPTLMHVWPGLASLAPALVLVLAAALAGGAVGARLADILSPRSLA